MDLLWFVRFGYALVIATFLLMVWVSSIGAREVDSNDDPPCPFNPQCTCSKQIFELGILRCINVHLPRIPENVNRSKVYWLHLEDNGLRSIEPHFLQSTGLFKISIVNNPLSVISDEAFLGLERSLGELNLSHNRLTKIPNHALRYLQKLKSLDLSGNYIATIAPDNWRGLESTLQSLVLTDNFITTLPTDAFTGLPIVETIDLRGNNLKEIDPSVFRDGMGKLTNLILADNQLSAIPYQALSYLKSLRNLDLSHNKINKMQPASDVGVKTVNYNFQLNLDVLELDYNQISILEPASFQYFNVLNRTYLDGNQLSSVEENAFRQAKIRELYLRNCNLKEISPLAFGGLDNYLEVLDLSGNHITSLPEGLLSRLELLRTLSLRENVLSKINTPETGLQFSLYELDLSGGQNAPVTIQELRRLRNLRVLSLSRLSQPTLSPENFAEFGTDLEDLRITGGGLQTIKNNAFQYVHGLRHLDLSDNMISNIEQNAFADIGHSLVSLKLSHALSSSLLTLPSDSIRAFINLEEFDVANNKIKNLPDTSFHFLKKLRVLNLQDNIIELLHKGTFQGDIHHDLQELYLSFNNLRLIQQHTFADLEKLEQIYLDDNKIESLDGRSFMNLKSLTHLNLKGNKITSIAYEAFQNLPYLEDLDLSYNKLPTFDFSMLDQVGTLSMFNVNVSHNKLVDLKMSSAMEMGVGGLHANIKVLDLSFNNITTIAPQFFKPVETSLSYLSLSHNKLLNATKDVFGRMHNLQFLDISHNTLYEVDFDAFRNTKQLQLLYASHNRLAEIPNDLFRSLTGLRLVDFSHNRLRSLPDNLFRDADLESIDLSHNLIGKLPLNSLAIKSTDSLTEMDLSWNNIASLSHGGMLSRFKKLTWLDLSYNRLAQIDSGTFQGLPHLTDLNLAHNSQLTLEPNGLSFQGLEYTLLHLNLDNVSLSQVPTLPTTHLITLSLAHNVLPTVSLEIASNISSLRTLNLDYNDLTSVPIVTHSLPELRFLSLVGNPITTLTNTSLLGVANRLEELDIRKIDLTTLESGAFCKMNSLRTLKVELCKNLKNFNLHNLLQFNGGIRNFEIHVEKDTDSNLESEMFGDMSPKLHNFTFSGRGLKKLGSKVFQGLRSPTLHLVLRNTSLVKLSSDLFHNMGWVRNVSVDVRDNIVLKNLNNPSTGSKPNLPRSVFLTDVKLTGGKWSCDCDLGWVEVWQRKYRQFLCGPILHKCQHTDDDLRTTLCPNKNNQSLIEVLKSEIECGWSGARPNYYFDRHSLIVVVLMAIVWRQIVT